MTELRDFRCERIEMDRKQLLAFDRVGGEGGSSAELTWGNISSKKRENQGMEQPSTKTLESTTIDERRNEPTVIAEQLQVTTNKNLCKHNKNKWTTAPNEP